MSTVFEQVKAGLKITDFCLSQKINLIPCGGERCKALCPFHTEKSPSFVIYGETGTYYCFGCQASGNVVNLAAKIYGCRPYEAVIRLNREFQLGIPLRRKLSRRELESAAGAKLRRDYERQLEQEFQAWVEEKHRAACKELQELDEYLRENRPHTDESPVPEYFQRKARYAELEDVCAALESGRMEKIMEYFGGKQ